MAFIGADTEALRDAGARHATTATTIGQLAGSLGSSIQRPEIWMGMDGEAFRARYSAELSPSLRALEELLRVRAQELEAQAAEQDAASNAGSGVSLADSLGTAPLFSSPGRPLPPVQNEASGRGAREESTEATTPHPNDEFKTEGPPATPKDGSGLGEGVPGTEADAPPPPEWVPTPGGAGEHDSEFAGPIDRLAKEAIRAETEKKREEWPDASDHMDHFLDNSGEDYQVDVDRFLNDNPDLSDQAEVRRHTAGRDAVEKAKAEGVTGPVTYPLSTPWIGGAAETENWYYATGSYDYNQTGTVTVYPPDENNPTWRYEVETQVNFRDRYDWDPWKQTPVDERNIEDEQLGALHRAGIAQEYNLTGESSPQRTEGTA